MDKPSNFVEERALRLIETFSKSKGRDINERECREAGLTPDLLRALIKKGVLRKISVTNASGSQENRYKVQSDSWKKRGS